ncbi:MAG: M1 family metallopeptidase [Gammaproteobacteria bacterium]|nr:M1 family metallopeptidase [Gammaproteobacteria bacterium]
MSTVIRCFLFVLVMSAIGLAACQQDPGASGAPSESSTTPVAGSSADEIPLGQLPQDVAPVAYQIDLTIMPERDRFNGTVVIELDIDSARDHFYLHGQDIIANDVRVASGDELLAASYEQVDDTGIARISLPQAVQGRVRLHIDYDAPFNKALHGLYKVSESGRDYAFTQFEAISARLAFPGFDEPRFKTPFDITLRVAEDHVAISNTPELSSEIIDDMKVVRFASTKPLPTYLIAFAVGDLDVVEWADLPATDIRPRPLPLRGIAVKGKGEQLAYALEGTNAIVTALESYFGTPYPWAKLDILAVPDFAAGAMENAGAITYRETLLLFDDTATPARKRRYKMVHAHELAHQWFGDLVTPAWWNDIWLNEAFATWMAHVAMDIAEPDSNYRRDLLGRGLRVMAGDSLVNARQIRQPILSNNDIATAFDGITYSKGGAVLSMFENLLGREDFRQGVRNYMGEFQYGTATADDFIRHLAAASTEQSKELVIAAFNSFLEQPGLPLVEVASECSDSDVSVSLTQSRYFPLGSKGEQAQQWKIPVCLRTGSSNDSATTCLMLTEKQQRFELPQACPEWIMPNANSAGYYRFAMSQQDWSNLLANSDKQNPEEMMAMLGSLTGAFNSGDLDVASLMAIAPQLIANPGWQIAIAPIEHMEFMYNRMADERQKPALEARFAELYTGKMEQTGLGATDDREKAQLQAALVEFLAETAKHPALRAELVTMARAYSGYGTDDQLHTDKANPIIIGTALAVAVDELGNEFVDYLLQQGLSSTDAVIRGRALTAAGNTKDPAKSAEVRELVLSPDLRNNEIWSILFPQAFMPETRDATWTWIQENLDGVLARMPKPSWGRISSIARTFCDSEKRAEVEAFFADRIDSLTGGPRSLAQALERVDLCIAKVERHRADMDAWLGQ